MENAVKALEYAFAILIFVIALSASMYLLSEVKTASDTVFSYIDTKKFYTDASLATDELTEDGNIKYNGRIVNIETIVPTLYRNYKENYVVEFYNLDGKAIIRFDLSEENSTGQIWTGNSEVDVKKRMDLFLNGGPTGIINDPEHDLNTDIAFVKKTDSVVGGNVYAINSQDKSYIVRYGLYNYCKGRKFSEEYAYVPKTSAQKLDEDITKIIIRYKEVN